MRTFTLLMVVVFASLAFKSDKPAYKLFDAKGKAVKYDKMLSELAQADVVFFGELHNNPISHWLQLEITKDLYEMKEGKLVLAAEMFESDNQLILNEYLNGNISKKSFENEARLWPNYSTDYAPLVEFAKDSNLQFVAANIPRRYASIVYSEGFEGLEALEPQAKSYIAPLPIAYDPEIKCYADMLAMGGGHGGDNLPKAQAIKDATMGYSIAGYSGDGKLLIHYNGTYHSNNYEGILIYLNQYKPGLKIMTIASVEQADIDELSEESVDLANFILVIPEDMTKTH